MSINTSNLRVETVPVSALRPYSRNARTHSKRQIEQIADSIKTFGWTNPILADAESGVIAGHGRLEAAKHLGMTTVPVIRVEHMSEAQKRAYIIADNKLAENAGWDNELLSIELQGLYEMELDFDLEVIGFETPEIDFMLQSSSDTPGKSSKSDAVPEIDDQRPAVTKVGDIWHLGEHRLICGDSLKQATYDTLLEGERADLIFTDPPYNVPIDGHVCGLGRVKHDDFAMASGEMDEAAFTAFLATVFRELKRVSTDGSIHFVCMDWRHMHELLSAGKAVYSELKNICVWNKTNGGMGSLYRSKHEMVAVFKSGTASHINNVELGKHGRYRTNVWDYAGVNSFGASRDDDLAMHSTVKPVALVKDAILDCSHRGGMVLDPFAGSGTTLIAAHETGRRARCIELEPKYVDVICRRFQTLTGKDPIHASSGKPFSEIAAEADIREVAHVGN